MKCNLYRNDAENKFFSKVSKSSLKCFRSGPDTLGRGCFCCLSRFFTALRGRTLSSLPDALCLPMGRFFPHFRAIHGALQVGFSALSMFGRNRYQAVNAPGKTQTNEFTRLLSLICEDHYERTAPASVDGFGVCALLVACHLSAEPQASLIRSIAGLRHDGCCCCCVVE